MDLRRGGSTLVVAIMACITVTLGEAQFTTSDPLQYKFDGRYGQVEVGGRYVGMEFHHSRPAPSRISFFYPVANSIDLSTDYWKRDGSMPLTIGVRSGNGTMEWLSGESWSYVLSPHQVTFVKETDSLSFAVTYEFCFNEPAAVLTIRVSNIGNHSVPLEMRTRLALNLRTCQTYAWKDSSWMSYDSIAHAISAHFDDVATDSAVVFVQNVGESPVKWTSDPSALGASDDGLSRWLFSSRPVQDSKMKGQTGRHAAAFAYRKMLSPSETLSVVQVIGSCRNREVAERTSRLHDLWKDETRTYDQFIRSKAEKDARFETGDKELDRSTTWARALIAANAHYLDGAVVPMPCPAEYNFFFTHDLLLTNLGAVNFDLQRVKNNLLYVVSRAKDSVIPHAYYWRDDGFKTEYCEPENWNNLWFVLVSGSYLRHSLDEGTGQTLLPYVTKCVRAVLSRLRSDGLMHAYRPDWWDIGQNEGPRAYLTALAIRALREYLFISSFLHRSDMDLVEIEHTADTMQHALVQRLWSDEDQFLTNYNEGTRDNHFYAGSLIASVYNLLDEERARKLVVTAGRELVDERIGLRIAAPVDFNTDSVIQKFKFAGAEAGTPYTYANGGVWPHGNAWYALALKNVGKVDEAYDFVRRTMTIGGIAQSPNGLPAMYEYRYSDPHSAAFGTIDKPSFLWAGGMYLQVLYRLLAIEESEWNLSVSANLPSQCDSISCSLSFGDVKELSVRRSGDRRTVLVADGEEIPSCIFPLNFSAKRRWLTIANTSQRPVLVRATAIVHAVGYEPAARVLRCDVSSFIGHRTTLVVLSDVAPQNVTVDGVKTKAVTSLLQSDSLRETTIEFVAMQQRQHIVFEF